MQPLHSPNTSSETTVERDIVAKNCYRKKNTMKGRESKGPPSADLLVCFPSRARLALMPKPISSPARPAEPKRHIHRRNSSRGAASPQLWAKHRPRGSENMEMSSEPTSPKVTCAGQIKVVRPKPSACKNWQSVMEEIERIHNDKKNKKQGSWGEALGFKKDAMQFLSCLRRVKFDFRCFGNFPSSEIDSEDEDEDDEEEDQLGASKNEENGNENSKAVFSKWFMVLQDEPKNNFVDDHSINIEKVVKTDNCVQPPANALLLMRCRSAPAKSWLEEKEEEDKKNRRTSLEMVMKCDTNFYEVSPDIIVKETWLSGGMSEYLSRSRSCKR